MANLLREQGNAPIGIENKIEGAGILVMSGLLYIEFKSYNEPTILIVIASVIFKAMLEIIPNVIKIPLSAKGKDFDIALADSIRGKGFLGVLTLAGMIPLFTDSHSMYSILLLFASNIYKSIRQILWTSRPVK
ncbi:hypothetical protein [Deinococcus sp. UYEF24]